MKSIVRLCVMMFVAFQLTGFGQTLVERQDVKSNIVTKSLISHNIVKKALSILPNTGGTSQNARAPQGYYRYIRTCYVITAAELKAAGVPSGIKFTSLGFNYVVGQSPATTGNMKIYLQNTTDNSYAKTSLNWSNAPTTLDGVIDNMTLVQDGSVTIPASAGYWSIPLSNGSAFTYTGGGIYVAYEYSNPAGATATTANTASCNTDITTGLRNASSSTAMPTALGSTASAYRPETTASWAVGVTNDAAVLNVYSFGKVPLVYGFPLAIKAYIQNTGDNDLSQVSVTLSVTGANTFTSTKVIPSLSASSLGTLVTFDSLTFTNVGKNNVVVTLANDANNANNSISTLLETTSDAYTVADTSSSTGSLGWGTSAGLLLAKYFVRDSTTVNSVTVTIGNDNVNPGNTVYGVVLNDAGKILAQSSNYVIKSSDLNKPVNFTFTTPLSVKNQNIYIGLAQTANATAGYYPLATQTENPGRAGVYYIAALTGGTYTEAATYGRFMIQANLSPKTVPVELSTFTSSVKDNVVTLKWSTATETNNSGFQIERKSSKDNVWAVAGFVKGNSTSSAINNYSFSDNISKFGVAVFNYRLKQIDFDGTSKYYDLSNSVEVSAPVNFALDQNYPNPFNPTTTIRYSVAMDSKVRIDVYDVLGRLVKNLVNENKAAGNYSVDFNASNLSSGVYMYKISAGNFTAVRKMNLMK